MAHYHDAGECCSQLKLGAQNPRDWRIAIHVPNLAKLTLTTGQTMKRILAIVAFSLAAQSAIAGCFGTGSFKSCMDDSGNTYNVQRFGNSTHVDGYSSNGSNWSQDSNTIGNTTYHNGYSVDGDNWNGTSTKIGDSTFHSGTDSEGNYYQSTCNQYGCY
jgi:hypothetical protein